MSLSIRTQARLYRIWGICRAVEWNLTAAEIAERMGDVTPQTVGTLLRLAGWSNRVRASNKDINSGLEPQGNGAMRAGAALVHDVINGRANALTME